MKIYTLPAKSISYSPAKRPYDDILYIVIHYTGNKGDTAENNAKYFASGNTRAAGAHFFVDKKGIIYKSINISRAAYAVGGRYAISGGAGTYYGKCTNANSVSIELCDCCTDTSWEQMKAVKQLVAYIRKKCPNAKTIIRHWDVNGKNCPAPMAGKGNTKWKHLHSYITKGYQYKVKAVKKLAVRSSGKVTPSNKIGTAKAGKIFKVDKVAGNWGRLTVKASGKRCWVNLKKCTEI